jgi:hypothetical protein
MGDVLFDPCEPCPLIGRKHIDRYSRRTVPHQLEQLLAEFPGPLQLLKHRRNRARGLWHGLLSIMGGLWMSGWAGNSLRNLLSGCALHSLHTYYGLINVLCFLGFLGFLCSWLVNRRIEAPLFLFFIYAMNILLDLAISPAPVHHYELWRIYVSTIAMICGVLLVASSVLAPDAGSLVLDDEGFWIKGYLGKRHKKTWMETSNFRVEERNAFMSIVVYDNVLQARSKVGKILSALRDRRSALHGLCDLTPETLALLMTQWRERALQH